MCCRGDSRSLMVDDRIDKCSSYDCNSHGAAAGMGDVRLHVWCVCPLDLLQLAVVTLMVTRKGEGSWRDRAMMQLHAIPASWPVIVVCTVH